ncbi:exocyst complex component EXO70B1 [Juglans microcarpa x Juglans regia]|uniref:exocyst complex component EXO70B1 n=1 Tax=Juglans microcarpa x Juglans regia TaxID=2249226 RepID=UPI001B7EA6D4|nr:exocyst complex component EXO70B1 [Juglans microcarpa x Juglans regia]
METNLPENSPSFGRKLDHPPNPREDTEAVFDANQSSETDRIPKENVGEDDRNVDDEEIVQGELTASSGPVSDPHLDFLKVSENIDEFLSSLPSNTDDNNENENVVPVQIPHELIDTFLDLVEAKLSKLEGAAQCGDPDEDLSFLEAVHRISNLTKSLRQLKLDSHGSQIFNRIGGIHQRAMSFLEEEFRFLLEESRTTGSNTKGRQDQQLQMESESTGDMINFPGYPDDVVSSMNKMAKEMISGGYESECCQVYMAARSNELEESLHKQLGFEKHSIDEVQRMQWESLEREIATWTKAFKQCATLYFSGEKALAEAVFSDHPSISASLFGNLTRGVLIQLLDFAEGVAMTKQRSAEKLFKFLDMYENLRDLMPSMESLFEGECGDDLKTEINLARCRLGETAILMFCDLENSIKFDTGKTPVPGGAVHPLTRYSMNYLKYACEYKDTLEQVFREHSKIERADSINRPQYLEDETQSLNNQNETQSRSPFSAQLMRVMELLDSNLEGKAKLYKDVALSNIFMMNNGRYILQKIKGSTEIHGLMGDTWCRKRSSDMRQYHKNYQRETWNKLLGCLNHEGLNVNGKVVKPVLKERFKSFNQMFDEIHKTQSTWVVSDEQLQSELRVSISAVVIPAYRSFLGRFSQYLQAGRQTEKYVKFQPEDIEDCLDKLFEGNPASTARRRP